MTIFKIKKTIMKTKNIETQKITAKVNNALKSAKKSLTKANDFALNTTAKFLLHKCSPISKKNQVKF